MENSVPVSFFFGFCRVSCPCRVRRPCPCPCYI